jgi:hypothetical protein
MPTRPLHVEYLRVAFMLCGIFALGALVFGLATAFFFLTIGIPIIPFVFAAIIAAVVFAAVPVALVVRRGVAALDWYREQSQLNQETTRANTTRALEVQIINASGRATVNVNSPAMNTTNQIALIADSRAQTRDEFIAHYREMIERAQLMTQIGEGKTGFEARLFLKHVPGGAEDYKFRDGQIITRAEYDQLMEFARVHGTAPESRRRGAAGHPALPKEINAAE